VRSSDEVVGVARDGAFLRVRVRPRARRDAVVGADARAVRVDVRAAPERGKATAAAACVIAEWLGVPRAGVLVVGGATSREKRMLVRGKTPSDLRKRLSELVAEGPRSGS
jgi:uncharacterized protein (TIGR00251 family)